MIENTYGEIVKDIIQEMKEIKQQLQTAKTWNLIQMNSLNRRVKLMSERQNILRTSLSMMSPDERKSFHADYADERREFAELTAEILVLAKERNLALDWSKFAGEMATTAAAVTGTIGAAVITAINAPQIKEAIENGIKDGKLTDAAAKALKVLFNRR